MIYGPIVMSFRASCCKQMTFRLNKRVPEKQLKQKHPKVKTSPYGRDPRLLGGLSRVRALFNSNNNYGWNCCSCCCNCWCCCCWCCCYNYNRDDRIKCSWFDTLWAKARRIMFSEYLLNHFIIPIVPLWEYRIPIIPIVPFWTIRNLKMKVGESRKNSMEPSTQT